MVIICNIIGCIFMGLMAYFLWAAEGWLWMKTIFALVIGFLFITFAQTIQIKENKHE